MAQEVGGPSGRVVVVTGGSRGIGRAIALSMCDPGGVALISHFDPDDVAAEETVGMLEAKGATAEQKKVDVSDFAAVQDYFNDALERYGRVDVLVNNAGITADTLLVRMDEATWDRVLGVNLKGAFNCCKAVVRPMMQARSGSIINVASVAGVIGNAGQANYSASKAGLIGLTKTLAKELGGRGVRVNAVAPGIIETEMTAGLPDKVKEGFLGLIALGRTGTPDDVADVVAFLASDAARYLTGQVLHVSGGMYM